MKPTSAKQPAFVPEQPSAPLGRRGLLVGAGVAGVAAVAASALHRGVIGEAAVAAVPAVPAGEGYRLTPHVLRYYEPTKA